MKKLTTFFLTLLLALLTSSAFATTFEDGKVIKIGEPVTEVQTGQWYALYCMVGGWLYDKNAGEKGNKAYWVADESSLTSGMVANEVKDYILQLEDSKTEGAYYIKYANDTYMYMWASSQTYAWSWSAVSTENIVKVEDTDDIFAIHETDGNYCLYSWADGSYASESYYTGTVKSTSAAGYQYKFYPVEIVDPETEVEWEMTSAGWGTLILPFAAEVPSGLTAHSCAALEEDGTTLKLEDVETLEANTPYILSGTAAEYTFSGVSTNTQDSYSAGLLTGTFKEMDYTALSALSGTVYLLQNHEGENGEEGEGVAFYPVTNESTSASLGANHCYLTLSSASGVRAYIGFPGAGEETGIVAVESETLANDVIYDLSGRRVSKAVKGVYIQNGKKVLVK